MYIINKTEKISEKKWIEVVNSHENIISLKEFENLDKEVYGYALFKFKNKIIGRLLWDWQKEEIGIEVKQKLSAELSQTILDIATCLNANFFINKREIFDPKRHLPFGQITINRNYQYFEPYDLEELRWIAIRSDDTKLIIKTFKFKKIEAGTLEQLLLNNNHEDAIILTPPYEGWTFLIGSSLPKLLLKGNESSSDEALNNQIKAMQKLSKPLIEIQYFEYSSKSNTNGYIKAKNGKLVYAKWKSELESFTKGKTPKELKNIDNQSAHNVASIWSIDSMDFVYIKKFTEIPSIVISTF